MELSEAMIHPTKGNILHADVEAMVNTVNCVGIMGRGVAAQFKDAFPANFKEYKAACDQGEVQPGRMFVHQTGSLTNPRLIINFPTKRHWKGKSRIEDIVSGLADLRNVIKEYDIRSIAIPPLGSGLGGLNWSEVRPLIVEALSDMNDLDVWLYEPTSAPAEKSTTMNHQQPNWTVGRALMVVLMNRYQMAILDPFLSLLEVHKLLYLAQAAGLPLRLTFNKALYGPYGKNVRHVLKKTEGYFTSGFDGEADNPNKQISIVPGTIHDANEFLSHHESVQEVLERVSRLVEGWETPHGLELLATVHWVVVNENATGLDDVVEKTYAWNDRKKRFSQRQIRLAYDQLLRTGWIGEAGQV
ncbi:MAG: macro domain-containing protein [Bryobacter sp.]|jgi:O-acetyl-ADP-ribose deacetylase (regulator of RNase III)|nr:macro domain-containing protein [Bryobacter sp. CoA8 C33]MCZ8139685.1 macro domain-containing protein [Fimbriimonadaceae bacterium]